MGQGTATHTEGLTGKMEASSGHSHQEALLALKPHVPCTVNELVSLGPTHRVKLHLVTSLHCCLMAKKVGRSSLHTSAHNEQEKVKHILKKIF